jgi:LuxR family maltose regulon positive regulatory protein
VLILRALLQSFQEDGQAAFTLYEQALNLLSADNSAFKSIISIGKLFGYSYSSANDAVAAIKNGYQAVLLAQEAKQPVVAFSMTSTTAIHLIGAGRLHEAEQLLQQAILWETPSGDSQLPWIGWVTLCQAEILCERTQLARARVLATEAVSLCEQAASLASLLYLYWGYAVLIRICLSCRELDDAWTALQQVEQIGQSMNRQIYLHLHSCFTTIDQVRLWLACGELDRATLWAEQLDFVELHLTSFVRERQEVARVRILLAQKQPTVALQRLEPVLQRATTGQRWGHVIEIRLLQALAHQKLNEEPQALTALSEAVRLGEPEGYIRIFVDEGAPVAELLSRLREQQCQTGSTPYLDTLLAAFAQESKRTRRSSKTRKRER